MTINKNSKTTKNNLSLQNYKKCYKKYCNKIITKKQLTKKLIKQFTHFEKGKNNKNEKRKNLDLIIKSDNCIDDNCKFEKTQMLFGGYKNKKTKQHLDIYQK